MALSSFRLLSPQCKYCCLFLEIKLVLQLQFQQYWTSTAMIIQDANLEAIDCLLGTPTLLVLSLAGACSISLH